MDLKALKKKFESANNEVTADNSAKAKPAKKVNEKGHKRANTTHKKPSKSRVKLTSTKKSTKNTPLKTTKTEVKSNNVTSNNKSGHVLLTPIMIDVHQVAQLDALKQTLGLKNRAQATALVMNNRQTVADIVNQFSKKHPEAKKDYNIHYESFLISHKPKVERNYRKYHTAKNN